MNIRKFILISWLSVLVKLFPYVLDTKSNSAYNDFLMKRIGGGRA